MATAVTHTNPGVWRDEFAIGRAEAQSLLQTRNLACIEEEFHSQAAFTEYNQFGGDVALQPGGFARWTATAYNAWGSLSYGGTAPFAGGTPPQWTRDATGPWYVRTRFRINEPVATLSYMVIGLTKSSAYVSGIGFLEPGLIGGMGSSTKFTFIQANVSGNTACLYSTISRDGGWHTGRAWNPGNGSTKIYFSIDNETPVTGLTSNTDDTASCLFLTSQHYGVGSHSCDVDYIQLCYAAP